MRQRLWTVAVVLMLSEKITMTQDLEGVAKENGLTS
jgi:hypothetical protein